MSTPKTQTESTPAAATAAPVHSGPRVGRIVVGVDGSDASVEALRRGIRMAEALHTSLEVVTTWTFGTEFATSDWSPDRDAEEIVAESAAKAFGGAHPDWVTLTTREGRAAPALIEASRGAEMLVVGSRGHGGVAGLLLGSVSAECAEHANCPVLVMHAPRQK
ncbi:universal stress protein [soil metagenome]